MAQKAANTRGSRTTPGDRVSRAEQIAGDIRERITRRELRPGDRLPTESALSQHFGVSRPAVREAIARLRAEGLVETLQGSGAFVRDPQVLFDGLDAGMRSSVQTLLDLIAVRKVIEGETAALAAERRTPEQLEEIERAYAGLCDADLMNRDGIVEDCAFHAGIAAASGNVFWKKLTESLSRNIAIGIGVTRVNEARRKDFSAQVKAEHLALLDALRAGDPVAARKAAIRHLESSAERILAAEEHFWKQGGASVRDIV